MTESTKYSREWYIQQSREAQASVRELAKLYPGCFHPDGTAIVATATLPVLGELRNAPVAAPSVVPPGWKLVPIEPTEKMLEFGDGAMAAASTHIQTKLLYIGYCAMLNAAPEHPAE